MIVHAMTYNIRLGIESNLLEVAQGITCDGTPDIVALQEVGNHWNMGERIDQTTYLADAVGLEHSTFIGALQDESGGEYGIALLSRWPITDPIRIRHPQIEDEDRVLFTCRVEAPTPFLVVTSHFSICEHERYLQAGMTVEAAKTLEGPMLILGDFGVRPDSPECEHSPLWRPMHLPPAKAQA